MTRTVIILSLALILTGCQTPSGTTQSSKGKVETVEQNQKEQLLAEIDRKYENPEAHYQLGKLYYEDGLLDKAEHSYKIAIGFKPVHYRAQAGLVRVAIDRKETNRAQIMAEMYITQVAVTARGSLRLGKAFQNEGLGDYAVSCYLQAAGLSPKSAEPYKLLGYYYLAEGDKVRAEEYLRRSFELDPYQPEVSGELGRIGVIVQTPRKGDASAELPAEGEEQQ